MNNLIAPLIAAAVLCFALFGFAFVAAPHSCEWGLSAYFWAGVAVVVALLAMPWVLHVAQPLWQRLLVSLLLGSVGALVWLGGLFAANVRIICRMI